MQQWWFEVVKDFEKIPETQNVFELYRKFSESFTDALEILPFGKGKTGSVLDTYQSRGALAAYWNELNIDLKSVAASGWNAELIPDDEILESQYPGILRELREKEARKDELEAMFWEVNELEEDVWSEEDYEVWPAKELKEHKDLIKLLKGELKEKEKRAKDLQKRIKANEKAGGLFDDEVILLRTEAQELGFQITQLEADVQNAEVRIARNTTFENELKQCKKVIKEIKDQKQKSVDLARMVITAPQAKELILKRWNAVLHQTINGYLQTHSRNLLLAIENLHNKYTTPLQSILNEREREMEQLNRFLVELGYED